MAAQVFARIVATFLVFCSGVGPVLGSIITGESMSANIHKEHVMLGDFILEVATGKGELAKKWRAMKYEDPVIEKITLAKKIVIKMDKDFPDDNAWNVFFEADSIPIYDMSFMSNEVHEEKLYDGRPVSVRTKADKNTHAFIREIKGKDFEGNEKFEFSEAGVNISGIIGTSSFALEFKRLENTLMVGNFSLASDLSAPDVIDFLKAMKYSDKGIKRITGWKNLRVGISINRKSTVANSWRIDWSSEFGRHFDQGFISDEYHQENLIDGRTISCHVVADKLKNTMTRTMKASDFGEAVEVWQFHESGMHVTCTCGDAKAVIKYDRMK